MGHSKSCFSDALFSTDHRAQIETLISGWKKK